MSVLGIAGVAVFGAAAGWVVAGWRVRYVLKAERAALEAAVRADEAAKAAWEQVEACQAAVALCSAEREHLNRSVMAVAREHGVDLPERRGPAS